MFEILEQALKKAGFKKAKDYTLAPDDGIIRFPQGKKRPKPRPPKR